MHHAGRHVPVPLGDVFRFLAGKLGAFDDDGGIADQRVNGIGITLKGPVDDGAHVGPLRRVGEYGDEGRIAAEDLLRQVVAAQNSTVLLGEDQCPCCPYLHIDLGAEKRRLQSLGSLLQPPENRYLGGDQRLLKSAPFDTKAAVEGAAVITGFFAFIGLAPYLLTSDLRMHHFYEA